MTQGTRSGIATMYRGIRFRSRLEARWAIMFDRLGWRWEYEPFDANGYIPDFVLLGPDPVLVEVKPAVTLDELEDPVWRAREATADMWSHDILGLGVVPTIGSTSGYDHVIGYLDEGDEGWDRGPAVWNLCGHCGRLSFRSAHGWFRSRLCGHHDGDHYCNDLQAGEAAALEDAWALTHQPTQWRP